MDEPGELLHRHEGHRAGVVRTAYAYAALTCIALALLLGVTLPSLLEGSSGAVISGGVLALFAWLFFQEAYGAWRDLHSEPTETRGAVRRTWAKGTVLWFFRSHYVHVERAVFDVPPTAWADLQAGDVVRVEHWPRTKRVIAVHRIERSATPPAPPRPRRTLRDPRPRR